MDHDFASYGEGKIVPHGLYDVGLNKGHVNIGTSRDTAEFACDSVAHWWENVGKYDYAHATQLLLTCDGGGAIPPIPLCFDRICKPWPTASGWKFALPTIRRTVPNTTRSNTAFSLMSRAPAKASSSRACHW
ncbi:MAG: hypothetical protein IPK02_00805 [Candidatus Accumulibacter sp.]|uniref:Uncharacterized protein n=1 Tax=Candidatus Accumulibacter affinis TaxID=2954384 RepID=A0A935T9Z7_9PROT|nr:hypothetical protein [Candidatus Accumulibacter affinis]